MVANGVKQLVTASTELITIDNSIVIFPNPVRDVLSIQLDDSYSSELELINNQGISVYSSTLSDNS